MSKVVRAVILVFVSYLLTFFLMRGIVTLYKSLIFSAVFTMILLGLVIVVERKKLSYFGFKKIEREKRNMLLSVFGAFFIYIVFHKTISLNLNPTLFFSLFVSLILAFFAEVLYCGYLQNVFSESFGVFEGIAVASIIYTLIHFSANPYYLLETFILRFFLGYTFSINKNLAPPVVGHWTYLILGFLG